MQNTGFCMACFRTWRMMSEYPLQLGINRVVQRVLFVMQSITIPLVCTGCAYWAFLTSEGTSLKLLTADTLIGAMVPAFCVLILSTIVARSFATVYEQVDHVAPSHTHARMQVVTSLRALLLTTYYSLLTTYYLLLTTYYLLLTTYYLLLTTCYLLLATCYLLLTAYYLLLTTNY